MSLPIWIAFKYIFSRRSGRYAPLLSSIAIISMAIGTAALIIVMSVMSGFRNDLADRLMGFNAHITLEQGDGGSPLQVVEVRKIFEGIDLRDIAPYVQGEVIAQSVGGIDPVAQGARVSGLDGDMLGAMGSVEFSSSDGINLIELIDKRSPSGFPYAIIGNEVANQLSIFPGIEDQIELIAPLSEVGPTGELLPKKMTFSVAGTFSAGVFDYDSKYVMISTREATRLLGEQAASGWKIRIMNEGNISYAIERIKTKLPAGWKAVGWNEQNSKLFAALELERIAMGGVLAMAMIISSFAIVGVVMLVTAAKRKDIAVLQTIGMDRALARSIFMSYAAILGTIGSSLGFIIGMLATWSLKVSPIHLPKSYYLDLLPVDQSPIAAIIFALTGIFIAIAASYFPVRGAMNWTPCEALRYE